MEKKPTWEEDPWSDSQGELPHIAAQNPLGPSRSRLRRQIATFRGDAVRLLKDARQVLVEIGYLAGDQIEALRTSFDRACVTLPDGRRLLATDHAALIAFAMANKIPEEMLWERITVRQHGRVTEGRFNHLRVTDITALPGCTKIEDLQLDRNEIEDISPLANCGALVSLRFAGTESPTSQPWRVAGDSRMCGFPKTASRTFQRWRAARGSGTSTSASTKSLISQSWHTSKSSGGFRLPSTRSPTFPCSRAARDLRSSRSLTIHSRRRPRR